MPCFKGKQCPKCKGSGYYGMKSSKCPICKGDGCSYCITGKINKMRDCDRCYGDGIVFPTRELMFKFIRTFT